MTTKMLLLVSRFKNYSIAGTTYRYTSVSSLYHVKQIDNVSNICDLTLEQDTPDGYEVSKENKFSISHRIVYNVSERNFRNFQTNVIAIAVGYNQNFLSEMQLCARENVIIY